MKKIMLKLRAERVIRGLTQKQMAQLIGVSEAAYSKKEKCKYDFTLREMKAIREKFNLSPEKIIDIFFDEN